MFARATPEPTWYEGLASISMLVCEIVGLVAIWFAFGWGLVVADIIFSVVLVMYTGRTVRAIGEFFMLFICAIAVSATWPDYTLAYNIVTIISAAIIVRMIVRHM